MDSIKELTEKIRKFRDERDWGKFHNHKDMALSLVLEAAEVLEHFQWKTPEEVKKHAESHKSEIADELADAAMHLFELAGNLGIDLGEAVLFKLKTWRSIPWKRQRAGTRNTKNCSLTSQSRGSRTRPCSFLTAPHVETFHSGIGIIERQDFSNLSLHSFTRFRDCRGWHL